MVDLAIVEIDSQPYSTTLFHHFIVNHLHIFQNNLIWIFDEPRHFRGFSNDEYIIAQKRCLVGTQWTVWEVSSNYMALKETGKWCYLPCLNLLSVSVILGLFLLPWAKAANLSSLVPLSRFSSDPNVLLAPPLDLIS